MASTTGNRADRFLPPDPRVEEPYLFTPRMALRVAILAAIALAVFAVLLLRLWSLQVLSGSKYEAAARNNQLRTFPIEAQRGPILDRNGRTLVTNAASTAVDVVPIDLPKQGRYSEMKRLSMVLNVPLPKLLARLEQGMKNPLTPVTMQVAVHPDQVAYLAERNREFPGVQITPTYLRKYNTEALLAHVLGYVGEISPGQLVLYKKHYKTCQTTRAKEANVPCPGDRIGQAGVEQSDDKYLRGRSGEKLQRVDSLGGKVGNPVVTRAADGRLPDPADDRHLAPAGGRAGAPVRHQPRAPGRPLARQRRRDRGDEPVERRGPGDGLLADLQAEHLRRPDEPEEARAAARPEDGESRTTTPASTA